MDQKTHERHKPPCIAVARSEGTFRVLALRPVPAGATLLTIEGILVHQPSRFSVQVGLGRHIDSPPQVTLEQTIDNHPWRYLNHSCDPNCMLKDRNLIAVRPIKGGEELTFHYATNKLGMAETFYCDCKSLFCLGEIRGFRFLDQQHREHLHPLLAEYLKMLPSSSSSQPYPSVPWF